MNNKLLKKLCTALAIGGIFAGLTVSAALAQTDDKMAQGTMSHQDMMDKMGKMSADDKAAMFDKMPTKDKMAAAKMAGHDMSKMSHQDAMDAMGKMSNQDKADALDKMPDSKKMAMMKNMDKMNHDKMDHQ